MKEIEILVKVLESKKSALKKLSKFKIDHVAKIVDKYYIHPKIRELIPTKTKSATSMLRVRTKNNKSFVTYKKGFFSKKQWLYSDEYETEIKDPKIMMQIFEKLSFKPIIIVDNTRTVYYYKNYEICLEEVKNLGLFLEIECTAPGTKNPLIVRKEIFKLIEFIGIKVSDEVQAGKAELLWRKKFKKQ